MAQVSSDWDWVGSLLELLSEGVELRAQLCYLTAQLLKVGLKAIEALIFGLNSQSRRLGIGSLGVGDRVGFGYPGKQVSVARLLAAGLAR